VGRITTVITTVRRITDNGQGKIKGKSGCKIAILILTVDNIELIDN